ncbi:hypothetical protein AB0E96_15720 [Kitasatospora sp. NPDC036755]|uniref:hypothetical protein n=1 Tax=Kitasatospora sp. NPDC036755 TaxID=3154600 RepID=UPI0033DCCFF8
MSRPDARLPIIEELVTLLSEALKSVQSSSVPGLRSGLLRQPAELVRVSPLEDAVGAGGTS